MVSWKLGKDTPQQSRQAYPSCQAPISVNLGALEQYLKKFLSSRNKLKRKVVILEQQQEENLERFRELQFEIDSHDVKFQQIEEFRQNMITEAQALKGLFNQRDEKLTEQLQFQTEFQTEFRKHFDDHKSAVMKEIVNTSKRFVRVHEQNARLEQQCDQKSSSSGGCCMGVLRCLGNTPAAAPAVAVVPGSVWDSTAAPMLPSQLLSEQQQLIAELQRKMQQLEATSTGRSSGSGGHWPARH